ncbi:shiftless antiviral inhibitor of ribosomal frameshifting protein homolog [Pangasianodon hypophthalmus]|uniref:shiftless antiviral inhibitor of ribosomal frameshifting protein homolog n=1 Tax=Pangasianodon hypophthalmus TaxID=310915 RepID=UPI000F0008F4|nr:shiftless antiviral inhibitor of ribosomal frameshifting protein homolog [Pangasianodon hypophthalmus]XP_026801842.3 shiftless antiviral inhibitor of ribosomal frameshifting protein homolog [Pangasianodon hypophthalmus]
MSRLQEEVELEKCVRRLRETFHGNIPIDKATLLMRRYRNNYQMVAKVIILMKDQDLDDDDRWSLENDPVVKNVVEKLQNEEREKEKRKDRQSGASNDPRSSKQSKANKGPQEDKDIQELGKKLRVLPLTEKNKRMFDRAQQNQMLSVEHQFACELCDKSWWRRVPERKRVSRCRQCKRKYDPVPPNKMWGIAEFMCPNCARSFKGFGRMDLGSPCYSCRFIVMPTRILPPRKNLMDRGLRRRHQHSCLAEDCYNRQEPHVPGTECVHPVSRMKNGKPQVVNPSHPHISSGSTVNTCLSQGSLIEDLFDIIMDDIREEDESNNDSGSSTSS